MTTNQAVKLAALRAEALTRGDPDTVTLVDAALAGDVEALATLKDALRSVRAAATGRAAKAPAKRRSSWANNAPSHPWTQDEEN